MSNKLFLQTLCLFLFNYFVCLLNKTTKMILEKLKKRTVKVDSFTELLKKAEEEYKNYLNKKYLTGLNH